MGAGNRYTLEDDRDHLCYYIDLDDHIECDVDDFDQDSCDFQVDCIIEMLNDILMEVPQIKRYGRDTNHKGWPRYYFGDTYIVALKSGNHNEMVIDFELQHDFEHYGIQKHNYTRSYEKLCRLINKTFELCQGHGYTSSTYEIGELEKEFKSKS